MRKLALLALALAGGCSDDPEVWLTSTAPADGCPHGGTNVSIGPDTNDDGALDPSEVRSTSPICNPEVVEEQDEPAALTATAQADTDVCPWGGTLIHFGRDTDGNGTLEASEITSTQPICRGAVQATGVGHVWTGDGADDRWSNPANWNSGRVPEPGDDLAFYVADTQARARNDLGVGFVVGTLTVFGGLEVYGDKIIVVTGILHDDSGEAATALVSMPVVLRGGIITVEDQAGVDVDFTITGDIEGAFGLEKAGVGTLELRGDNRYSDLTLISAGRLISGAANAIPDLSAVVPGPGTTFVVGPVGDTIRGIGGSGAVELAGPLVIELFGGTATSSGLVSGTGSIVMRGEAVQRFSTVSDTLFTGSVTIESGAFRIDGDWPNATFDVREGGTFAATGEIAGLVARGTVIPGNTGIGTISVTTPADLRGALVQMQLGGASSDALLSVGGLDISGARLSLFLAPAYVPAAGTEIVLFDTNGILTGTFADMGDGSVVTVGTTNWLLDYGGGEVSVTYLP